MKLIVQLGVKLVLVSLVCIAQTGFRAQAAVDDGNQLYEAGKFEEAIEAYRSQIESSGPNPALLYNLGNSYFQIQDFGRAIHAYEQALALDAASPDIQTNLRLAQEKAAVFDSEEPGPLRDWSNFLSLNQWGWISLFALATAGLLMLTAVFASRFRRALWLKIGTVAALFALVVSGVAVYLQSEETSRGIILEKDTPVLLSPFPTAEQVSTLSAGRSVNLRESHSDYVHIGQGWVSKSSVAPIYQVD